MEAVLVSNGPGELYTWVKPVLNELRHRDPNIKISISLIPCQFANGNEAEIARTFGADVVSSAQDFMRFLSSNRLPEGLGESQGFVLSLGGNSNMALRLGNKLAYPTYRYSFEPYWNVRFKKVYAHDERLLHKLRQRGAPSERIELVGNLVADAVEHSSPVLAPGEPHLLLIPGSRERIAVHLIPFMIALADALGQKLPRARFIWPVSRLLSKEAISAGIAGQNMATADSLPGQLKGDYVLTPNGTKLELVAEAERYAHMCSADLAVTIPGTNTLELGIAGVPSIVILPLNKPELIPLDNAAHWLAYIPGIGKLLKSQAVKNLAARMAVSLPNRLSAQDLMTELKGEIKIAELADQTLTMLADPAVLARQRQQLLETMPRPGAAAKMVASIMRDFA